MRSFAALLLPLAACAQTAPFTIGQALSAAFPSELTAAADGRQVAWVSNARGVRNILAAEAPAYRARQITAYTRDDGQELQDFRWTPDASSLVYVRGGTANPDENPLGASEEIWIARLDGAAPRRVGPGSSPAVSPDGALLAYVRGGQVWWEPLAGGAARTSSVRGSADEPVWSPDSSRIAFAAQRGDHSVIVVIETATGAFHYLDVSTDFDSQPVWSPDGRQVAFARVPSSGLRAVRQAQRSAQPWSIRIAGADSGAGRQLWRASAGPGSVVREVSARRQLIWTPGGRIVFPWEGDGWTHLYSIPARGGEPALLTPGDFEVEDVAASANRIVYSSNQGDIDRRHIWEVEASGGTPHALTSGEGIECAPQPLDGAVAFLRSDASLPLRAAIRVNGATRDLDPQAIPPDFPSGRMVAPKQVTFPAADGLLLHGQLFLPPHPSSARAPAVVFFHGGPRRQMLLGWHDMLYYANAYALNQYLANAGFVVLSVNFRGGIGYGLNFREAPGYGASGASDYNDVLGAASYLQSRPDVDRARIGAWGGSYGGFLTALALARDSAVFRAGVDFHGVHNWATELRIPPTEPDYKTAFDSSPMASLAEWRSPVLLIAGDDDPDVQFNQTVMLAGALRRQNVPVETLIFPDEVHEFLLHRTWVAAYEAAAKFLSGHLQ
ncbi:MAG TPA: prolyl oligopeptidase family serine peptidase [Bryobacteraceae bacterium]|nr:prolyl oligopeptidase family serine peptidase [Bryobacteraceae bacterium]